MDAHKLVKMANEIAAFFESDSDPWCRRPADGHARA
jgi:hypothetical protein